EGAECDAGLVRHPDTFVRTSARGKSAPDPKCAFVQMRQKLRTDHSAEGKVDRETKAENAHADRDHPVTDRPADRDGVPRSQELHGGVVPLFSAFRESVTDR